MKKKNKTLLMLSVAALSIPLAVGSDHSNASTLDSVSNVEAKEMIKTTASTNMKKFSDITDKYVYRDIIYKMTAQKIINGYEDGTFKPNEVLSRKHASALVNRAVDKLPKTSKGTPKDLSTKNPYYDDLMALYQANLLEVDHKGNINPNKALSRGEMAKIIAVAFDLEGTKHPLKDVSKELNSYVSALYENNVTTGYEDGTFKENSSLTRSHFAVFMYRSMNIEDETIIEEKDELFELTKEEYVKIAEMVDVYAMKKEDIPRPKGVTTEQQEAKQVEIRLRELHNGVGGFGITDDVRSKSKNNKAVYSTLADSTGKFIEAKAKRTGMSFAEFTEIINEIVKTGEVYESESGNFSMYYNYDDGNIHYSDK